MIKMFNSHSRVAIAQIVFYVHIIPLAVFVVLTKWFRHGAWIPLLPFSLIRLAGGIITILLEGHPGSVGLIIATLILLGVGVIPLIISMMGFIRIILASCFPDQHISRKVVKAVRILFTIAAGLLIAGGSLDGNYKSAHLAEIGEKLVKAGYLVFASILGMLIAFHVYLWMRKSRLSEPSMSILKATSCVIPFLIVRTVYALLSVFATSLNSKWDSLYGSAVAFAFMALLMEYFAVCIYLNIGITIPSSLHYKEGRAQLAHPRIGDQELGTVVFDHLEEK